MSFKSKVLESANDTWFKANKVPGHENDPIYEDELRQDTFEEASQYSTEEQSAENPKDLPQTQQVLKLVEEGNNTLFHDQFNVGYLAPSGNGVLIFRIRSRQARSWLTHLYWKAKGAPLNPNTLNTIIQILEARALYEGSQIPLSVRVAKEGEAIWHDLGDKAVQITAEGWDVIEEPPILFRRFPHQKSQVEPKHGGRLEEILDFINLERKANGGLSDDQLLVLCWLVFGLVPGLPHPAPILNGPQGSKKSTFHKVLKTLLDSSSVEVKGNPRDLTEFVQTASHHWLLILDNVTSLKEWLSDAICRIITGGGFSKRELYSDDEDILYNFQHILAINGINLVVEKADLLERSLIFGFKRTKKFKTEKVFWSQFEERKPYLLGAMFDTLVKSLQILTNTPEPEGEFRMADFAHWGSAIAQALGYNADNFLEAYKANISNQNKEALEASLIGTAILHFMSDRDKWYGTPTELLSELEKIAPKHRIDINHKSWPNGARWLWRRINDVLPNLEAADIKASKDKDDTRLIILERISKNDVNDDDNDDSSPSTSAQTDIKDNTDIIPAGTEEELPF